MSYNDNRVIPQTAAKKVLLVDDDAELCLLMVDFFTPHGFDVEPVHDGQSGLARAIERTYDLVILDVMLPVLDGFAVLRQIRRRSDVPVIMLTARIEERDRVAGLDMGADDYLPKPFGPDELLARMRAVLRRSGQPVADPTGVIVAGDIRLNSKAREVWKDGQPVELTSVEFDILDMLMRAAGRVVTRDEVSTVLYQRRATPFERSIDVHISHLRKKLEGQALIRTIRGSGYLFAQQEKA